MNEIIKVLLLKDGRTLVTKIEEVVDHEIGEPDCVMIDPVIFHEGEELSKAMTRFPSRVLTSDTKMAIHSDTILTMVTPDNKLLAEYLVTIGD